MKKRDSSGIILVSMMVIGLLFITGCSGEGADPVPNEPQASMEGRMSEIFPPGSPRYTGLVVRTALSI